MYFKLVLVRFSLQALVRNPLLKPNWKYAFSKMVYEIMDVYHIRYLEKFTTLPKLVPCDFEPDRNIIRCTSLDQGNTPQTRWVETSYNRKQRDSPWQFLNLWRYCNFEYYLLKIGEEQL